MNSKVIRDEESGGLALSYIKVYLTTLVVKIQEWTNKPVKQRLIHI